MFEAIRKAFERPELKPAIPNGTVPSIDAKRKAWVVILEDGRVGYIDHYKINGQFGVRPVGYESGLHYPNTSTHWTPEQRLQIPEEISLKIHEFRAAADAEIPPMWRSY